MARRTTNAEPAFGTDSFLDVTANLVGVLIVLIVLVGLRVRKSSPPVLPMDEATASRLAAMRGSLDDLDLERLRLEHQLLELRRGLTAKQAALAGLGSDQQKVERNRGVIERDVDSETAQLKSRELELAEAQSQLVSLSQDFAKSKSVPVAARPLVHRSPISRTVESDELTFELLGDRVTFIDVPNLVERVRLRYRSMGDELRTRGRAMAEVEPVGAFRARFTMVRQRSQFNDSMFSSGNNFHDGVIDCQFIPVEDPRGESVDEAIQAGSKFERLLARHSPRKYAITIWTYSDSFGAYRQLRDFLSDRGYAVSSWPLPIGELMRMSDFGARSLSQ